jgi:hypothetical protein
MITEPRRSGGASLRRAVVITWLVTAAWDFVCATLLGVLGYGATFNRFWQGVASVPFGPSVFQMGSRGTALGLTLHLLVALVWSTLFVVALNSSVRLRRLVGRPAGAFLAACIYGPFIWLVMSLVVIHLATGKMPAFGFRWWVQIFAHIPFVAIPLVFTARRQLASAR